MMLVARDQQMASQGDDDESPHTAAGCHVTFQIGAGAGAKAAEQQQSAAPAGGSQHAATGGQARQHQQHFEAPPKQQPKPNFWATAPIRLTDYTRERNGVHQEDVGQDELLAEAQDEREDEGATLVPSNQPRSSYRQ